MQRRVLQWGETHRRDLPWRRVRDPWSILVAEAMLQQTQVDRVIPKWIEFLARWPEPAVAAAAGLPELLATWQGLGYPRRVRNLRTAAQICVSDHDGSLPTSLTGLLALPGVGPYTARAILVFAFEEDEAVVDTNIARVLARVSGEPIGAAAAQRAADELVPAGRGWEWNQTLMDVGALLCRPTPRCESCPIAPSCAWQLSGHPDPDPARRSAGVSRAQSSFAGSDRELRGAVLRRLAGGGVARAEVEVDERMTRVVASLIADELVAGRGDELSLAD